MKVFKEKTRLFELNFFKKLFYYISTSTFKPPFTQFFTKFEDITPFRSHKLFISFSYSLLLHRQKPGSHFNKGEENQLADLSEGKSDIWDI